MSAQTDRRKGHLTRRQALGMAGVAGAAYVTAPLSPFGAGGGASDPEQAAGASCVLAPEVTEGPYWVDTGLERSNVVGGQPGVPLKLDLHVYRADDGCAPQQGAIVDVWHCNASGLYSDEAVEGTSGQTWLRGYQETDANGLASFTTIYPGWYSGRAVHIHVRVRVRGGSTTSYDFTTQVFFAEADTAAVLATSGYRSPGPDTPNASDSIYRQEVQAGNVLQPALGGSAAAGYSGSVGIGLSGLPASGSGSGAGDSKVAAKLVSRKLQRSGGRREVALKIRSEERVAANAQLLRGGEVIAHKRIASLGAGSNRLALPVANRVAPGPARLKLTLRDRAGNEKVVSQRLRLPAA
ncbi:MAG: intradiol ring-cleavage dioxygenase [Solirubrobacterales bacterium]